MTNKEAKEKLYMEWQKFLEDNVDYAGISEAYKTAFKALEQEPYDDAISRAYIEPIIEELENICANGDEHILDLLADIKNAPPVNPQQKQEG